MRRSDRDSLARSHAFLLELMSDPRRWQAMQRAFAAAIGDQLRAFAYTVQAMRDGMRQLLASPWLPALTKELNRPGLMDRITSAYCVPYEQEVADLGLPPLSAKERLALMVAAGMVGEPEELVLGQRPPLAKVALAGERLDVALALGLRQGVARKAVQSLVVADDEVRDELAAQAALALGEKVLPSLQRQLKALGIAQRAELRSVLAKVTQEAYLVVALRHALSQYLRKEALHHLRETATKPASLEDRLPSEARQEHLLDHWVLEQSIARCLRRRRAKPVDGQILRAIAGDPERSSASIARELGLPATTVRYRRRQLMEFLRQDLEE